MSNPTEIWRHFKQHLPARVINVLLREPDNLNVENAMAWLQKHAEDETLHQYRNIGQQSLECVYKFLGKELPMRYRHTVKCPTCGQWLRKNWI